MSAQTESKIDHLRGKAYAAIQKSAAAVGFGHKKAAVAECRNAIEYLRAMAMVIECEMEEDEP